jgi:alkylation response protein AidB-like acyl-CoA dehydrogenase
METAFITACAVRDQVAAELNTPPSDPTLGLAKVVAMKEAVVEHATKTVEKAVEIAGGRSFFRKSPLERLARDVRAAGFHPPSAPISFQMAGERFREARTKAAATA